MSNKAMQPVSLTTLRVRKLPLNLILSTKYANKCKPESSVPSFPTLNRSLKGRFNQYQQRCSLPLQWMSPQLRLQ